VADEAGLGVLGDLTDKFLGSYDPSHARSAVADYDYYFLGSIVLSRHDGATCIIDGQQRLTTLTLLLIYLHNLQRERSARLRANIRRRHGERT
jgi:uncharacterized protein with ParB-like and HNH nuclease domain